MHRRPHVPVLRGARARVSDASADALLHAGLEAVRAALRSGRRPELSPALSGDAELGELLDELGELNRFALAIGRGDLDQSLSIRGSLPGALKNLHAALRHLTWQTQRVAAGDFTQRVDFMGEFSKAFNAMVAELEQAMSELAERNEQLVVQAAQLDELATTDALTGVFNRRKFNELVEKEIDAHRFAEAEAFTGFECHDFPRIAAAQVLDYLHALARLVSPDTHPHI